MPTVTGGSLVVSPVTDTPLDYSESFSSRNAMSSGLLNNPLVINQQSGSVSDGNGGANYSVTYQPSTAGAILPLPITVTAATRTKPYDGTTSAPQPRHEPPDTEHSVPPWLGGDTPDFIETYNTPAVGTGKTLIPSGSVNDGITGGLRQLQRDARQRRHRRHHAGGHPFRGHCAYGGPPSRPASTSCCWLEAEDSSNNIVASYAGTPASAAPIPRY